MTKAKKRHVEALRKQLERRTAMAVAAHSFFEQLVPVQPMQGPSAQLMYMDIVVGPNSVYLAQSRQNIR